MTTEIQSPPSPTSQSQDQHKDSCSYSVEVAKQFITLSSAGIAFIVGIALTASQSANWQYYTAIALLAGSMVAGLMYLMSVVGHIHAENNYDVYTAGLKTIAIFQILLFFLAILILAKIVYERSTVATHPAASSLEVDIAGKKVRYVIPSASSVTLTVKPNNEIQLALEPTKKVPNSSAH